MIRDLNSSMTLTFPRTGPRAPSRGTDEEGVEQLWDDGVIMKSRRRRS